MTILVTGGSGSIGKQVVAHLVASGAKVHALSRTPAMQRFPNGVTPVKADMMDVEAMRAALAPVSTLFLLNAVTPDELSQALITLNLAREAGIERIVYFSVLRSDVFADVPHFAGKHCVERMIERCDLAATILRPAYFMQNDLALKDAIGSHGVYPMPIGGLGQSMVDTRDIADVAAAELLRRERSTVPLPREVIDLVGPDALTGASLAGLWAEVLGKPVRYGGDDLDAFENHFKSFAPAWMAYDMRLMMNRFQRDGMVAAAGAAERLSARLGRPLRTYRDFAVETACQWSPALS